ncbi:hypothetical protein ACLMJK_005657 [Lecanora helva]
MVERFYIQVFLTFFSCLAVSFSASANSPPKSALTQPLLSLNISGFASIPAMNMSSPLNAQYDITCDGAHFGWNPNVADCASAINYISPDTEQLVFGQRHTALRDISVPLPHRFMGDQGECFFQTIIPNDRITTARASLAEIKRAASALLFSCAEGDNSQGGVISQIGGDNKLYIVLGIYKPRVQCRGTFGLDRTSCQSILMDMPADKVSKTWGMEGQKDVQEELPLMLTSGNHSHLRQYLK